MGKKVKALKSTAKIPGFQISADFKVDNHKSFESDDEFNENNDIYTDQFSVDNNTEFKEDLIENSVGDDNDDNLPEIIFNSDASISQLKEIHENIQDSILKKKKRKVRTSILKKEDDILDKELDIAILSDLKNNHVDEKTDINNNHTQIIFNNKVIEDSKVKKIGCIEVEKLDDNFDIISSYQITEQTKDFIDSLYSSKLRVPVSRLISSKSIGPAKIFKVK